MKRGLLIIDRGSREQEVRDELDDISARVRQGGGYQYCGYCFLEVLPPFIKEGVAKSLKDGLDQLTIVPYFLYPGRKVKAAVTDVMRLQSSTRAKFLVTRPMSMHKTMIDLVNRRIAAALDGDGTPEGEVDVLIVGHGSKDPNARMAIEYVAGGLRPRYRNVSYCFLEMEKPDIAQGIEACRKDWPRVLVVVFYFLHEGGPRKEGHLRGPEPRAGEGRTGKGPHHKAHRRGCHDGGPGSGEGHGGGECKQEKASRLRTPACA